MRTHVQRVRAGRLVFVAAMMSFACGGGDTAGPSPSLVGSWEFVGFSDAGVQASTTGSVVFRADETFSWEGTVTFPGEPLDSIVVSGTYHQDGSDLVLTIGTDPITHWRITVSADVVVLIAVEPPPANTISLRRL
jgi:hypothetical protein